MYNLSGLRSWGVPKADFLVTFADPLPDPQTPTATETTLVLNADNGIRKLLLPAFTEAGNKAGPFGLDASRGNRGLNAWVVWFCSLTGQAPFGS